MFTLAIKMLCYTDFRIANYEKLRTAFIRNILIFNNIPVTIRIQEKLENEIQELRKAHDEHTCRLLQMEENSQRRERNKLRDRLLQNYRYYTSKEHNPRQEWTRMESETFWECFADYENMNGNGYMHSVVQPEMNLLGIIEMDDASGIAELMHSRK